MVSGGHRPLPLQDPAVVDRLGHDLRSAGFSSTGVLALLGESAHAALGRGQWWPALRATSDGGALATLVRLFLLGTTERADAVAAALPSCPVADALANGIFEHHDDGLRAALDIRPHADDTREYLVVSDPDSDTRPGPVRRDHVLGIGAASISLARTVIRRPVRRALDVGTGCGIQSLHLSTHAEKIVGTDTNPRALALAAATAAVNGLTWELREGSLFEPVVGERFDLIVSNPPFVIGAGEQNYIYRDSGVSGDHLCRQLVEQAPDYLEPGGTAQFLANWLVLGDDDWRLRVGQWVATTGCDTWVVQREFVDPTQYVALWLADAGEEPAAAVERGSAWLEWFEEHHVRGIGMGSITLRRKDSGDSGSPEQVLDEITAAGQEVTGPEVDAFLARRRYLAQATDADLLSAHLSLDPGVLLTERSLPGHQGWSAVLQVLDRPGGPGASLQVDEWTRALFGGFTGQAPLSLQLEILAAAHSVDVGALAAVALPSIRTAIGRGIVVRVETDSS